MTPNMRRSLWALILIALIIAALFFYRLQQTKTSQTAIPAYHVSHSATPEIIASNLDTLLIWKRYQRMKDYVERMEQGEQLARRINYPFLHYTMGNAGAQLLRRLAVLKEHPQYGYIRSELSALARFESEAEWYAATHPETLYVPVSDAR